MQAPRSALPCEARHRRKPSPGTGLDEALARERPDARTIDEALAVVDDGVPDVEDELVAEGSLKRDEFASPGEAALSVQRDAPGWTDHEDPISSTRGDALVTAASPSLGDTEPCQCRWPRIAEGGHDERRRDGTDRLPRFQGSPRR